MNLPRAILATTIIVSSFHIVDAESLSSVETMKVEKLFEVPVSAKGDSGTVWGSSVLQDGETIIFSWFDIDDTYWVGKWQAGEELEKTLIKKIEGRVHDKMTPSLGIDSRGHIHMAAGMHNGGWEYWVSDEPHSIASFTKLEWGDPLRPPGDKVTYPRFTRNQEGSLFLTYRTRAGHGALFDEAQLLERGRDTKYLGMLSGALLKSVDGTSWQALGDDAPMQTPILPVLLWEADGRTLDDGLPGWYQTYRNKANFDSKGTLHYAGVIYGPDSQNASVKNGATYLIYAKSMDSGSTFQRADGQPISALPLNSERSDLVLTAKPGDLSADLTLGADTEGNPMIIYERGNPGRGFLAKWEADKKGWVHSEVPVGEAAVMDGKGVITGFSRDGSLVRSHDSGESWQNFAIEDETASRISDRANLDPMQALINGEIVLRRVVQNANNEAVMQLMVIRFAPSNP